jgi:rSAM/selenodomain-associated transferase 1
VKNAVVVFAREPVPGRVKTRLAAAVGEGAAARVYEVLLERTLAVVGASSFDPIVSLAEAPTPLWIESHELPWEVQRGADLGVRMRDAFNRRFGEGYDRVVIVGSDCPHLRVEHLKASVDALDRAPVVLGPAFDGGYWLVAQTRPGVDLLVDIPWSSSDTLAATRKRLKKLETSWVELVELDDVDTEDDLRRALTDPNVAPELRRRLENALRG